MLRWSTQPLSGRSVARLGQGWKGHGMLRLLRCLLPMRRQLAIALCSLCSVLTGQHSGCSALVSQRGACTTLQVGRQRSCQGDERCEGQVRLAVGASGRQRMLAKQQARLIA